jgi:hypothetical protein
LESANILNDFVQKHGGQLVTSQPLKIVKSPFSFFAMIEKWTTEFASKI